MTPCSQMEFQDSAGGEVAAHATRPGYEPCGFLRGFCIKRVSYSLFISPTLLSAVCRIEKKVSFSTQWARREWTSDEKEHD